MTVGARQVVSSIVLLIIVPAESVGDTRDVYAVDPSKGADETCGTVFDRTAVDSRLQILRYEDGDPEESKHLHHGYDHRTKRPRSVYRKHGKNEVG